MSRVLYILIVGMLMVYLSAPLQAQFSDIGTAGSISLTKDFNRNVGVSAEQELRFDQLSTSLYRSATSIGIDITLIRRLVHAQLDYDLLYLKNNDIFYEFRHRTSAGLLFQYKYNRLNYRFRTRIQATYRDENRGDYKFNPRYVWRNKLELRYDIFGSPLTPYLFGEMFCPVNSKYGFFMDGYRVSLGTKYKVSKRGELDFQLRFDQEIQQVIPEKMLYCCVGWNYKL